MTETFAPWLERQMKRRRLSQADVGRGLGISASAVSRWRAGNGTPDKASCAKLAAFFDRPISEVYEAAGYPSDVPVTRQPIRSLHDQVLEFMVDLPVRVPVLDQTVSAGYGQEVLDYVYLDPGYSTDGSVIAIRVNGASMEPDIHDGDVIVVDKELEPDVGDIVIAVVGDQLYVKWFRRKGNQLRLVGNTGDMPAEGADIQGVVTETIHRFRSRRGRRG